MSALYFLALLIMSLHQNTETVTTGTVPVMPKRNIETPSTVYKLTQEATAQTAKFVVITLVENIQTTHVSIEHLNEDSQELRKRDNDLKLPHRSINEQEKDMNYESDNDERFRNLAKDKFIPKIQKKDPLVEISNKFGNQMEAQPQNLADNHIANNKPEEIEQIQNPDQSFNEEQHIAIRKPKPNLRTWFGMPPPVIKHQEQESPKENEPVEKPVDKAAQEYYKLRPTRVNAFDFKFISAGVNICKEDELVYLVVLVLTTYYDIDTRETIRETWGSIAQTEIWPGIDGKIKGIKVVFMFGNPGNHYVKQAIIKDESDRYGDIIVADFTDSYYNLTYKVMMGLKWTSEYCRQANYIVKVDDDMFLHIVNLIRFLRTRHYTDNGEVIGYRNTIPKVLRTGIWGVPWDVFPFTRFPNYTNGNCYVIEGRIVPNMFKAAERLPYLFIEDAFFTGKFNFFAI